MSIRNLTQKNQIVLQNLKSFEIDVKLDSQTEDNYTFLDAEPTCLITRIDNFYTITGNFEILIGLNNAYGIIVYVVLDELDVPFLDIENVRMCGGGSFDSINNLAGGTLQDVSKDETDFKTLKLVYSDGNVGFPTNVNFNTNGTYKMNFSCSFTLSN